MYGDYVKTLAHAAGVDVVLQKPDGLTPLLEALDAVLK